MADFIFPTVKRITSHYGYRTHPITGAKTSKHHGTDFAQSGKHNIKATASGTVTRSYRSTSYGECVFILHNIRGQQFESVYAHMRSGSRRINVGQRVKQGQVIGIMGSTGNSTGQHLHFELHKGRWNINKSNGVDPLKYLPSLKDKELEKVQRDLKSLGYNPGAIDGQDGPTTQKAVKAFQRDEGLTADGIAGAKTKAKIKYIKQGGLTLKAEEKLDKRISKLEKALNDKVDKENKGSVSSTHEDSWKWAEENGILNGEKPLNRVTREQLASVEHSFYKRFIAADYQAEYAEEALKWAEKNGISNANNPGHVATRQQVITIVKHAFDLAVEHAKAQEQNETEEE